MMVNRKDTNELEEEKSSEQNRGGNILDELRQPDLFSSPSVMDVGQAPHAAIDVDRISAIATQANIGSGLSFSFQTTAPHIQAQTNSSDTPYDPKLPQVVKKDQQMASKDQDHATDVVTRKFGVEKKFKEDDILS